MKRIKKNLNEIWTYNKDGTISVKLIKNKKTVLLSGYKMVDPLCGWCGQPMKLSFLGVCIECWDIVKELVMEKRKIKDKDPYKNSHHSRRLV